MALVEYLEGGERPLAAQMNALFAELDRRMALMLSDRTFLLLPPARRELLHGLLGQCFYFLSADSGTPNFRSYGLPGWTGASYAWAPVTYPRDKRHALAEFIIENPDTAVAIPSTWDYYDTFRIHNLGRLAVTVQLDASTSITVPAWSCRTARRKSGAWLTGWNYFQKYAAGDPRSWYYSASPGFANNVVNPTVLLDWVAAFEGRAWQVLTVRGPVSGQEQAGRFQGARWQADPALHVPPQPDGNYAALDDATRLEDAQRHTGTLRVLDGAGAVVADYEHTGIATLAAGLAGHGVTVTRDGSGDLVFSGAGRQLHALSTNIMGYREVGFRNWVPNLFAGGKYQTGSGTLPLTADMRVTREPAAHALAPVDGVAVAYDDGSGWSPEPERTLAQVRLDAGGSSTLGSVRANGQTLGDLKELDWLWVAAVEASPYGAPADWQWLRTPAGLVLSADQVLGAYHFADGWLPEQAVFPTCARTAWPLVKVNFDGVEVRSFLGLVDGAWPKLNSGAESFWLSPRMNRFYGYKAGRSAPFVIKDSTADYRLTRVEINRQVPTAIAQRVRPAGTGFGWWDPLDPLDFHATFGASPEAAAARPAGVTDAETVIVGPLLHEHYNLLAWRVNSLAVYDPLDLQDLAWPLVDGIYSPRLSSGATIEWVAVAPNYFPGRITDGPGGQVRYDHYAGWVDGEALGAIFSAMMTDVAGGETGVLLPGDNPAVAQFYDERMVHYAAELNWTDTVQYQTGGVIYRRYWTGPTTFTMTRGSLSNWLDVWNVDGDPYSGPAHARHRWVTGDTLAALAVTGGLAFRHCQFGQRRRLREDEYVPDITGLQLATGYRTIRESDGFTSPFAFSSPPIAWYSSWSNAVNHSAEVTPNQDCEGLIFLGQELPGDPAGVMLDKQLPAAYPAAGWTFNQAAENVPFPYWEGTGLFGWRLEWDPGPAIAARRFDQLNLVGPLTGKTGSAGGSVDDGVPVTGYGVAGLGSIVANLERADAYTLANAMKNFSVVAWGAGVETLRRVLPVRLEGELTAGGETARFEGSFSEEQWGSLHQVFLQGIAF